MPLIAGTRLGPYEIVAPIGAGGMGEVFRAADRNLKRSVAIKILPASVAGDADRLARFQREAEVLAALNHPNIAAIYGLEKTPDFTALVMELVEGEDLSALIARGAMVLSDALPIAKQIADALEAAHEQGIIHRDLKPANIKVRPDGVVKVLDFGLAKAMDPAAASNAEAMNSPTLTSPAMTQAGMILGTAAYMAPEQARGRLVDKRADIWAFGVVVFEMLAGRRAFTGEDVTDTIVSVVSKEPDWSALPKDLPTPLLRLLRRCLDKDSKRRLRDLGEARVQIDDLISGRDGAADVSARAPVAVPARAHLRTHFGWATLVVAVALLAPLTLRWFTGTGPEPAPTRFELEVPPRTVGFGWPEIAPDGRRIAVVAEGDDQIRRIWIRSMDEVVYHVLPGTDGASYPFWSPNSQSLAFFADDTLKRIAVSGGPAQPICPAARARGGTWSGAGIMLFSASIDNIEQLQQVVETGGAPPTVLAQRGVPKATLRRFPHFLPDGRHFLFFSSARQPETDGVYIGSLDDESSVRIVTGFTEARFSDGFLFFVRDTALLAQPFDPATRAFRPGDPVPVVPSITDGANESSKAFSVSDDGTVVAVPIGAASKSQLQWFDRAGRMIAPLGASTSQAGPRISPDERLIVTVSDVSGPLIGGALWLTDAKTGQPRRLTFRNGDYNQPVWSTDAAVVFAKVTGTSGVFNLFRQPTNGGASQESLLEDRAHKAPQDVSADGRYLVYAAAPTQSTTDLWLLSPNDGKPQLYVRNAMHARLSPSDRWLAYVGVDSGPPDVYVESFPVPGKKFQISYGGGDLPVWSRDGRELFYQVGRKLMAVSVAEVSGTLSPGQAAPLFDLPIGTTGSLNIEYDVMRDRRFLFNIPVENQAPKAIVTLNWKVGLKK